MRVSVTHKNLPDENIKLNINFEILHDITYRVFVNLISWASKIEIICWCFRDYCTFDNKSFTAIRYLT